MPLSFELFATGLMPPDDLWALIGDPARLPEWTDAEAVIAPDGDLAEGDEVTTTVSGQSLSWTVLTAGERLWEARADTPAGALSLGARVAADPLGSRLVLACQLEPTGSRLRARLVTLPRLRGRCDRWVAAALEAARSTR